MSNFQVPNSFRDLNKLTDTLRSDLPEDFEKRGMMRALKLFHMMSERVPAYKDFLKKNDIKPSLIKNSEDFKKIPTIDKDNYLRSYSLEDLSWDGKLKGKQLTICTTSGSTGEPFYFPHDIGQDLQYLILAELYLVNNFNIDKKSTLYVNGFPMGAWIGGTFTHEVIQQVARRGNYDLSIISPGIHKDEIIKSILNLGEKFDQVIIGAYGPFLKDVIDEGIEKGVDWKKYNLGFVFSAEGFSEDFRNYVCKKSGIKDPIKRTLNHYGTVDLGTMSYETPLSNYIRSIAVKDKNIFSSIWDDTFKLPTLTQYIPELFFFESVKNKLICSAFSGIPLVRYDLKDSGGIMSYDEMVKIFKKQDIDLLKESKKLDFNNTVWKLPFVWVFERSDLSVSLYAFRIYPETVRKVLQKNKYANKITGKFTMMVNYDKNQNQKLEINVELRNGIKSSKELKDLLIQDLVFQLNKDSSEYRETYNNKKEKIHPTINFWPHEYEAYFSSGKKQKWVLKGNAM